MIQLGKKYRWADRDGKTHTLRILCEDYGGAYVSVDEYNNTYCVWPEDLTEIEEDLPNDT